MEAYRKKISEQEAEIADLHSEIVALENHLAVAEQQNAALVGELSKMKADREYDQPPLVVVS